MSAAVVLVDIFGAILVVVGFVLTFRQATVRRLLHIQPLASADDEDSTTYALRLSGAMMMALGAALAVLFTTFAHLAH